MQTEIKAIYVQYMMLLSQYMDKERQRFEKDNLVHLAINGNMPYNWGQEKILDRGFYLNPQSGRRLYIENELRLAHEACVKFWKKNAKIFHKSVTSLNQNSVALTRNNIRKLDKLPLYFDSLLIVDPFHTSTANSEFDSLHQNNGEEQYLDRWTRALGDYLVTYYLIQSILEIDLDIPVYLICPELNMVNASRLEQLKKEAQRTTDFTTNYLKSELDLNIDHAEEYTKMVLGFTDLEAEQEIIRIHQKGIRKRIKDSSTDEEQMAIYNMLGAIPNPAKREILALMLMNNERFGRVLDAQNYSSMYECITGSAEFDWGTIHDSYKINHLHLANNLNLDPDYLVMRTLEKDSIKVLNNFNYLETVAMREDGLISDVRDLLREIKRSISICEIEDFSRIVDSVQKDFDQALTEAAKELEKDKTALSRKYNKSVASFLISATISISTTMVPFLGQFNTAVTIGSLALGSSSLIDVLNNHVKREKKLAEFDQRPISVMLQTR